jgi:hypothetical protein
VTSVLVPPPIESQGLATAETTFHKLLLGDLSTDNILIVPGVAGRQAALIVDAVAWPPAGDMAVGEVKYDRTRRNVSEHQFVDVKSDVSTREVPQAVWSGYVSRRLIDTVGRDFARDRAAIQRAWREAHTLFEFDTPAPSVGWSDENDAVTYSWHRNGWHVELEISAEEATYWALPRGAGIEDVEHGDLSDRAAARRLIGLLVNG